MCVLVCYVAVVLSITGFSLFCVEDARLHRANDVIHFTQVWDSRGEHKELKEQRFPVLSVCPTTSDFDGQIKHITCTGYGPNSFRSFVAQQQQITVGTISGAEELFDCFTINEKQDFVGKNSSYFIKCDMTFNEVVRQGQARVTNWANHDVWPHAVYQKPSENTYKWKTVPHNQTTEFYLKTKKYDIKGGKTYWFSDMEYGQYLPWNSSQPAGPHSSFTVGHMYGMYEEHREEKLYTTNMMLGTVGGMAFLLSCLNIVAFAFFAGLLNIDGTEQYASSRGAMYSNQPAGGIPQSAPAGGSYGSI